ncbi:glycosyltransferase BC10-like [Wolffia australiana]
MKPKFRNCSYEKDMEQFSIMSGKDGYLGVIRLVTVLVIFMFGGIIGLSLNGHFSQYFISQTELFFPTTHFFDGCLGIENFIEPKQLNHQMSDEELFWRASMVPKKAEFPFKRVPKVAFMFLTRGSLPLLPLWERFFQGHEGLFSVYVHAFPGYRLNVSETSPFYGRQIPSQGVSWGSISLLDAERRLLANALLDFSNERFVLLSESCIPVFNFSTVHQYLVNSEQSYVESYVDPSDHGRGRYLRRMAPDIWHYQWRKGSEWFEMNRHVAVKIVSETKYYAVFRKYCRPSCYPDEHYIATFLNMFDPGTNSNRSVTWVDWSTRGPHPALFGRREVNETFIRFIRNNGTSCAYNSGWTSICFLFARKFAPSALEPLMNMSQSVMNF